MKKEKNKIKLSDIITTVVLFAVGAAIGFFAFRFGLNSVDETGDFNLAAFLLQAAVLIASIYIGVAFHIIAHEAGHLIGGLACGYKFTSFRVYHIIFVKEDGKIKTKRYNIAGAAGQCLMTPPEPVNGKFPYLLYNLSGGIANLIFGGIFFALYTLFNFSYAGIIFIPLAGIGVLLGLTNLIPLKMSGIANDGYNIMLMSKNERARSAFYTMLMVNASLTEGVRYKDMPPEWSELPEDFNDPISVTIAINRMNVSIDNHDFTAAKELAQRILNEGSKILEIYKNELRCELLFLEIIGERRPEEIERLYTKNLAKYIKASGSQMSKRRLMYAYHKLVTRDEAETVKALKMYEKVRLAYPYKGELELERELIEIIDGIT
ncbi:MAG: hypothetical protein FWG36_06120 [Oscillospiraceae bacterium]|nr:hypothetical protein [Oscillospiraceae bacterium]